MKQIEKPELSVSMEPQLAWRCGVVRLRVSAFSRFRSFSSLVRFSHN